MRKIICLLTGLMILTGCQGVGYSSDAYNQKLSGWLGKTVDELYSDWDEPSQILPLGNNTVEVSYYSSEEHPVDNDFEPYASEISYDAMTQQTFGLPTPPPLYYCKTSFTVSNGIVTGYTFNGDDCY